MPTLLDDELLQDFANGFFGYGNYQASYWFIGMEEGGGNSADEIALRLQAWEARGRREIEDVADYHRAFGISRYWEPRPPLETTWNKIIRILLAAQGQIPTLDEVRSYQRDHLGRQGGETCLLELLPLPSPSTSHWLYADCSRFRALANRQSYRDWLIPIRVKQLRDRIQSFKPPFVIFYGKTYLEYWKMILGANFQTVADVGVYKAQVNGTVYLVTDHPVATGVTNDYFHNVGKLIAAERRSASFPT